MRTTKSGIGKNNLLIIGGRANSKIAKNIVEKNYHIIYYYADRSYDKAEFEKEGFKCLDSYADVQAVISLGADFFIGIGGDDLRKIYTEKLIQLSGRFPINVIDPKATIAKGVTMGDGNLIMHNAFININSIIGDSNIFNTGCIIEHDNLIGSYNHFAPKSTTGGYVTVGNHNNVFMNSTILPFLKLDDNITIGSSATVTKSSLEPGVYIGTPAKALKK
jgi:acetyltransferase EpsM